MSYSSAHCTATHLHTDADFLGHQAEGHAVATKEYRDAQLEFVLQPVAEVCDGIVRRERGNADRLFKQSSQSSR